MRAFAAVLILAVVACASAYSWSSCGTQYDRLVTQELTFSANPGFTSGAKATIVTTGYVNLHMPFLTGAWQVRVYELGEAHSIYTTFGDLTKALVIVDNTTFTLTSSFVLPAVQPGGQNNFTASLEVTDQTKSTYSCIEIIYGLDQ